ncbi:MAG: lamin tail domain-containing protein [Bacteroidota bacterium]
MRRILLLLVFVLPCAASAQVTDTFADGDFTTDPTWSGDRERFAVVPFEDDFALRSDGLAESDTIALATPSMASAGRWQFRFRFEDNLTTGKGTRVYLIADSDDLKGEVRGYYVQIGTNNGDEIRLYRQDGPSTSRVELGDGIPDLVVGDAGDVVVQVNRQTDGTWSVIANPEGDAVSFFASDNTYTSSTHIGVWLKHTSAAGLAFLWDDFAVDGGSSDTTPPVAQSVVVDAADALRVQFSESIDGATIALEDFFVPGVGSPFAAEQDNFDGIRLLFASPFAPGSYDLNIDGLADNAGNPLTPTTLSFEIETDPPVLLVATALSATAVEVTFDEAVANIDDETIYSITPGIGQPLATKIPLNPPVPTIALELGSPLAEGTLYTVTARGAEDVLGNVQVETSTSFLFGSPGVPEGGDLVVNEIMYDPPSGGSDEYVELFNRSDTAFDLQQFVLADATAASRIADAATFVLPGTYAVLVRDATAFSGVFPDVQAIEVPAWRALNNGGDDVAIVFQPTVDDAPLVIDRVPYLPSWGGVDAALERIDPEGPSGFASNFATTVDPSGGTPGAMNSVFARDETPPVLLSVEARSATELLVRFDEPLEVSSAETASNYAIAEGIGAPAAAELAPEGDPTEVALSLATPLSGPQTFTLTVRGVADQRGNVLDEAVLPFFFGEGDAPEPGDLVVNEVMYDPPANGSGEYVEVFNRSTNRFFDLRDFTLDDASTVPTPLTSDAAFVAPGAYAVIVQDVSTFLAAFPEFDTEEAALVEQANWGTLNNSGDTVILGFADDEASVVIDSVAYLPSFGGDGVSLERKDPAGPSSSRSNFASSTAPDGGTPGALNSVFELDETPPELLGAEALGATVVLVRFDEPLNPTSAETPTNYMVSDGIGNPSTAMLAPEGDPTEVLLTLAEPLTGPRSYDLVVRAVTDVRGNTLTESTTSLFFGEGDAPEPGDLVINEIMYDPRSDSSGEYVEVFNRTDDKVFDLRAFALDDASVVPTPITDRPVFVEPGGYGVIVQDAVAFAAVFGPQGEVEQPSWGSLNNGGDTAVLSYLGGIAPIVIDSVAYLPSFGGDGVALERKDPVGPSQSRANYASSTAPVGGTPGALNSVFEPDIVGPLPIEGEVGVDERSLVVFFNEPLDASTVTVQAFTFSVAGTAGPPITEATYDAGASPTVTLRFAERLPSGDLVVSVNGVRDLLGNVSTDAVLTIPFVADTVAPVVTSAAVLSTNTIAVLFSELVPAASALDASNYTVDQGVGSPTGVVYDPALIGEAVRLTFETGLTEQTLYTLTAAGLTDRSGNVSGSQSILLFFGTTDTPEPGDIVVNEIMFDPLAGADGEYVELRNTTDKTFNLQQFRLTDDGDPDAPLISETPLILPPDGLLVLAEDPDSVRTVFGEIPNLFAAEDFPGLNNSEDAVVLSTRIDGQAVTIDSVAYSDDWHRPELRETDGIALERIAVDGPSSEASTWSSSLAPAGGTPGLVNSVFVDPEAPPPGEAGLVIDSPFAPDEGQSARIAYLLEADAALVRVRLFDGAGRQVRTLESGDLSGRTGFLDWDGRDDAGRQLRVGIYVVLLEALDAQGGTAEAYKEVVVLARRF